MAAHGGGGPLGVFPPLALPIVGGSAVNASASSPEKRPTDQRHKVFWRELFSWGANRPTHTSDETKLQQMGYRQELSRSLTFLNSFGVNLSVVSFFGTSGSLGAFGLTDGRAPMVLWGWIVAGVLNTVVGLCMAELMCAYPCSGGIYYWTFSLAAHRWRAFACWMVGWINLLGHLAFTASVASALNTSIVSQLSVQVMLVDNSTLYQSIDLPTYYGSVPITKATVAAKNETLALLWGQGERHSQLLQDSALLAGFELLLLFAILLIASAIASVGPRFMSFFSVMSVLWHVIGCGFFMWGLFTIATEMNESEGLWLDIEHVNTSGASAGSTTNVFLMGMLFSQWIMTGYDSSVQMAEETQRAELAGLPCIAGAVSVNAVLGMGFLCAVLYSMQGSTQIISQQAAGQGLDVVTFVMYKLLAMKYGEGRYGTTLLMCVPMFGLALSVLFSLVSTSRCLYAFSRDGGMLGSHLWRFVSNKTHMPWPAVICSAVCAWLLAIPITLNSKLFYPISAAGVVCLLISYMVPMVLRLHLAWTQHDGSTTFIHGIFHLGKAGVPLYVVSIIWCAFMVVLFLLPQTIIATASNMNSSTVVIAGITLASLGFWYLPVVGGRHWFTGPRATHGVSALPEEPGGGLSQAQAWSPGRLGQLRQRLLSDLHKASADLHAPLAQGASAGTRVVQAWRFLCAAAAHMLLTCLVAPPMPLSPVDPLGTAGQQPLVPSDTPLGEDTLADTGAAAHLAAVEAAGPSVARLVSRLASLTAMQRAVLVSGGSSERHLTHSHYAPTIAGSALALPSSTTWGDTHARANPHQAGAQGCTPPLTPRSPDLDGAASAVSPGLGLAGAAVAHGQPVSGALPPSASSASAWNHRLGPWATLVRQGSNASSAADGTGTSQRSQHSHTNAPATTQQQLAHGAMPPVGDGGCVQGSGASEVTATPHHPNPPPKPAGGTALLSRMGSTLLMGSAQPLVGAEASVGQATGSGTCPPAGMRFLSGGSSLLGSANIFWLLGRLANGGGGGMSSTRAGAGTLGGGSDRADSSSLSAHGTHASEMWPDGKPMECSVLLGLLQEEEDDAQLLSGKDAGDSRLPAGGTLPRLYGSRSMAGSAAATAAALCGHRRVAAQRCYTDDDDEILHVLLQAATATARQLHPLRQRQQQQQQQLHASTSQLPEWQADGSPGPGGAAALHSELSPSLPTSSRRLASVKSMGAMLGKPDAVAGGGSTSLSQGAMLRRHASARHLGPRQAAAGEGSEGSGCSPSMRPSYMLAQGGRMNQPSFGSTTSSSMLSGPLTSRRSQGLALDYGSGKLRGPQLPTLDDATDDAEQLAAVGGGYSCQATSGRRNHPLLEQQQQPLAAKGLPAQDSSERLAGSASGTDSSTSGLPTVARQGSNMSRVTWQDQHKAGGPSGAAVMGASSGGDRGVANPAGAPTGTSVLRQQTRAPLSIIVPGNNVGSSGVSDPSNAQQQQLPFRDRTALALPAVPAAVASVLLSPGSASEAGSDAPAPTWGPAAPQPAHETRHMHRASSGSGNIWLPVPPVGGSHGGGVHTLDTASSARVLSPTQQQAWPEDLVHLRSSGLQASGHNAGPGHQQTHNNPQQQQQQPQATSQSARRTNSQPNRMATSPHSVQHARSSSPPPQQQQEPQPSHALNGSPSPPRGMIRRGNLQLLKRAEQRLAEARTAGGHSASASGAAFTSPSASLAPGGALPHHLAGSSASGAAPYHASALPLPPLAAGALEAGGGVHTSASAMLHSSSARVDSSTSASVGGGYSPATAPH